MIPLIDYEFSPEAVVIGGGDFPTHPIPLSFLERDLRVVCCDGAAMELFKRGKKPWRIVGDCDSLSSELRQLWPEIVCYDPDQETNDQTKAVTYLQTCGIQKMVLVAATGQREDHTLGNIALLAEYLRTGLSVRLYTDHGVFIPVRGDASFQCPQGTSVSIFSFGTIGMRSEGLVYPLRDFTAWWQGTLNRTATDRFTIYCHGEYLVFLNYAALF